MKKYLVVFIFFFVLTSSCIACIHSLKNRTMNPTPENVGKSTFKIEVEYTVNLDKFYSAIGHEKTAEDADTHHDGKVGTAFLIAQGKEKAVVMTAGHVCLSGNTFPLPGLGIELDLIDTVHRIKTNDGREFEMQVLIDNDDLDVCLLTAEEVIGKPIPLSNKRPKIGQEVYYVGVPGGYFDQSGGITQVFSGLYGGHRLGAESEEGGVDLYLSFFSTWAEGGASGSPVFTDDGIVAMLVRNTHASDGGGAYSAGVDMRTLAPFFNAAQIYVR